MKADDNATLHTPGGSVPVRVTMASADKNVVHVSPLLGQPPAQRHIAALSAVARRDQEQVRIADFGRTNSAKKLGPWLVVEPARRCHSNACRWRRGWGRHSTLEIRAPSPDGRPLWALPLLLAYLQPPHFLPRRLLPVPEPSVCRGTRSNLLHRRSCTLMNR